MGNKMVHYYGGGLDTWRVRCDAVYINDVEGAHDWVKRHHDVYVDEFENGYEYYSNDGHMFSIIDFKRVTVTIEDGVEVWHVE